MFEFSLIQSTSTDQSIGKCFLSHLSCKNSQLIIINETLNIKILTTVLFNSYQNKRNRKMCQSIQPPTQQLRKCRYILQGLTAGLVVLIILSIVARQFTQIFSIGLLAILLYISWAQFMYLTALMFFVFTCVQNIQSILELAWLIQYQYTFQGKYVELSIFVIFQVVYYSTAIVLGHYVYKHIKDYSNKNGMAGLPNMNNPDQGNGQNIRNPLIGGQMRQNQQQNLRPDNNVFQGRGVQIG